MPEVASAFASPPSQLRPANPRAPKSTPDISASNDSAITSSSSVKPAACGCAARSCGAPCAALTALPRRHADGGKRDRALAAGDARKAHVDLDAVEAGRHRLRDARELGIDLGGIPRRDAGFPADPALVLGARVRRLGERLHRCRGGQSALRDEQRAAPVVGRRRVAERPGKQPEQAGREQREDHERGQHLEEREAGNPRGRPPFPRTRGPGGAWRARTTGHRAQSRIATRPVSQSTSTSNLRSPAASVTRPPLLPPSA